MKVYTLQKSPRKYKRFRLTFDDDKFVDFGADGARTFVDGRTEKERLAWVARHKDDKYYNDKKSGIYQSKYFLWSKSKLKDAIKEYERVHDVKIKLIR